MMAATLGPASASYLEELKTEVQQVDASASPHAARLLNDGRTNNNSTISFKNLLHNPP